MTLSPVLSARPNFFFFWLRGYAVPWKNYYWGGGLAAIFSFIISFILSLASFSYWITVCMALFFMSLCFCKYLPTNPDVSSPLVASDIPFSSAKAWVISDGAFSPLSLRSDSHYLLTFCVKIGFSDGFSFTGSGAGVIYSWMVFSCWGAGSDFDSFLFFLAFKMACLMIDDISFFGSSTWIFLTVIDFSSFNFIYLFWSSVRPEVGFWALVWIDSSLGGVAISASAVA